MLLIYNEAGSFTQRKVFYKKTLRGVGVFGVGLTLLLCFVLFDYVGLKYSSLKYHNLKTENHTLKADIKDRDTQIESFYARIYDLQTKLLKLNELEREIRSYAGIREKSDGSKEFGVGGVNPSEMNDKILDAEFYDQFLANLDKDMLQLDGDIKNQSQELEALWENLREQIIAQRSTPDLWPVQGGYISSKYGYRPSPFSGRREFHSGVDIAVHKGTPVYAAANGVVVSVGYEGGLGKTVVVDHGKGITTRYAHLSKFSVKEDQKIQRGEPIGNVGSTGRSTGPHLHYEVRVNNKPVNAEKYLSEYLAKK